MTSLLIGPRKINEIHFEGKANIVIRGIVDDGSMVLLEKIRLRGDEEVSTIDGQEMKISQLFLKAEGKQDVKLEFLRINGEEVLLGKNKLEKGQALTLLEGAEEVALSTIQLKAKARKGTSHISLWAEREMPIPILQVQEDPDD